MKRGLFVGCALMSLLGVGAYQTTVGASTNDETMIDKDAIVVDMELGNESRAWLNWSGSTYLTEGQWCNVIGDNNLFNADVKVTNAGGNPGSIEVQIVNSKGEIKGKKQTIAVGETVTFSGIPWNSGTFVVKAKASVSGNYSLRVSSR